MIVTDAWQPLTNGVVTTLAHTAYWLGRFGHEVRMITPLDFTTMACPTYPEIQRRGTSWTHLGARSRGISAAGAAHRHRGAARAGRAARLPEAKRLRFTTSYHTQFPQYLQSRCPIPLWASYWALRRFHNVRRSAAW